MGDKEFDFIKIAEVSRRLGMQTQYLSYYLDGIAGKPNLSEGLDIKRPDTGNYHTYEICRRDVQELIKRVKKARA
jgi:hypothetical protein